MDPKTTKPLQYSISDHQDTNQSIASVAGVVLEARGYKNGLNPKAEEVHAAAFPIPHAPVYLADVKDGCYVASGLTDNDGNFVFHNIPNGRYCIKVDHENSTVCDRKNQLRIDDEIEHLDVKAIVMERRMVARVHENPSSNHRRTIEEGVSIELASEHHVRLKLRVNLPLSSLKIDISDQSGWIVFTRNFETISIGYETELDLNHLERGTYIVQISGSNYSATKELILE